MLIVIPVSHVDIGLGLNLANVISTYARLHESRNNHQFLLVAGPRYSECAYVLQERLAQSMNPISTPYITEEENEDGWPNSANFLFRKASQFVYGENLASYFFWMECDMTPVRIDWADVLEDAYTDSGKRFMGCVCPTYRHDKYIGDHISGCAIYPANVALSPALDNMEDCPLPWDIAIGHEAVSMGAHTVLIDNKWNTINYRFEADGNIRCDTAQPHNPNARKYAGLVDRRAALVHGCKDSSLARILMGERPIVSTSRSANLKVSFDFLKQ